MITKALIFDMDGTAIDSMPSHAQSWITFAKRHQIALDLPDLMRKTTGRNGHECIEILFDRKFAAAEALELIAQKEAIYRDIFGPIFKEVAGFNSFYEQAYAKQLKLGFGSAGDCHNLAFAFKHLALNQLPLAVVGGDEGLPGKPSPAIFLEVARQMKIEPSACIVFEDSPFGIAAAKAAGMRAIGITTSHTGDQLAGDHVLRSASNFEELMRDGFLDALP